MRKIEVSLVAMVFLLSFGVQLAIADTEVSGGINSNTIWTVAGSPYIVVGTVEVAERATLTIEPGVTVKFNDSLSLNIGGELIARGTVTDSILFTSNNATPAPGDWGSMKFVDTSVDAVLDSLGNYVSGCIIEYSRIEYGGGDGAVYCDYTSPLIIHSSITESSGPAVNCHNSSPIIIGNYIQHNNLNLTYAYGGGIRCYQYSSPIISSNTIEGNLAKMGGAGIECEDHSSPIITENIIDRNTITETSYHGNGGGISCYFESSPNIVDNTITGNFASSDGKGGGVYCEYSSPSITGNIITGNSAYSGGGVYYYHGASPITGNTISKNRGGGIQCSYAPLAILENIITGNSGVALGCSHSTLSITNNTITANLGVAISCKWCSLTLSNNLIAGNFASPEWGGIYCDQNSDAHINQNNLITNGKYEVKLGYDQDTDIDASNNWWGTTNTDSIDARIWDYYDDITLGKVLYSPILTSPALGEPDSVYSVVLKSDETYTSNLTTNLWIGATMYIQLEGQDSDSICVDQTTVAITSNFTTQYISVALTETDSVSGIFRGTALIDTVSVEGVSIGATVGETITITSDVDSTKFTTVLVGENPHPFISNLDIGGSEDIEHLVSHQPLITWSYSDLQSLPQDGFQVQVGTDDDWSVAEMWDSGEVSSADTFVTYAGDSLIDVETYYLRARVKNTDDLWASWASLSFRMNSLPTIPLGLSPKEGEVISDSIVTLIISNCTDAEGDSLIYGFEVYSDSLLSNLVTSATGVEEGIDSTIWLIDVPLEDNHQYWWRASAYDGFENGEWMASSSFIINSENNPPGSFHLLTPADGGEVTTLKPILDWETSIDPDPGDVVTYTLFYGKDVPSQVQVEVGGESVYQIKTPLEDNQLYYWKVVAQDLAGATVEDEEGYQAFITNTANEDPNSFNLVTPTQNSVEVDLTPIFYWENATDNDIADSIHYLLWVGQDSNFSGATPTVVNSNCYIPTEELSDNSQYFWKVVAVDKESLTTSTDTWKFFTNVALEPPNPFSLIEPELGIDSVSTTPTFLWHKATDNDLWDYVTYTIYLSPDSTFSQGVRVISPADTHFTIPPGIPLDDNTRYYWKVVAMDTDSLTTWGSNSDVSPWWFVVGKEGVRERGVFGIPQAFALSQNYPNPFNPTTEIKYALPRDAQVRLEIYNLLGQKVATLVDEYQGVGYRSVRWDARGLASGVYLYRLEAGNFTAVKKLVVIK